MTMNDKIARRAVRVADRPNALSPYPDAIVAHGLVFTSGARPATIGAGFASVPESAAGKAQGFAMIDRDEGLVAESSWGAHAALEDILTAAGSDNSQILRQHVWQKDKRFFPVYEAIPHPLAAESVAVERPRRGRPAHHGRGLDRDRRNRRGAWREPDLSRARRDGGRHRKGPPVSLALFPGRSLGVGLCGERVAAIGGGDHGAGNRGVGALPGTGELVVEIVVEY